MKLFLFDAIIAVSFIHSLCCCAQERFWQAALPVEKCRGGIMAYSKARNAYVGDILVKNCNISDTHWHPFAFTAADGVSVSGKQT